MERNPPRTMTSNSGSLPIYPPSGENARLHHGDIMSAAKRSAMMARIKGKNTGLEQQMEAILREVGQCYCTHAADLPGRPDFVFRTAKVAIFVDGDFWHGWRFPAWRLKLSEKWEAKIGGNRQRDRRNHARLRSRGWTVIRIWEHQLKRVPQACLMRVVDALAKGPGNAGQGTVLSDRRDSPDRSRRRNGTQGD